MGPSGLRSSLDLMLPIINRKYPVLEIVEIDHDSSNDSLTTITEHWTIRSYPIYANEVRSLYDYVPS